MASNEISVGVSVESRARAVRIMGEPDTPARAGTRGPGEAKSP